MLMQQSRSLAKGHTTVARYRPMTAGRFATHQASIQRVGSHMPSARQSFAAPRISQPERESSGTLLPWADPYIADLQRRHEGELRRERAEGRIGQ